jgi:hypothetical protein
MIALWDNCRSQPATDHGFAAVPGRGYRGLSRSRNKFIVCFLTSVQMYVN